LKRSTITEAALVMRKSIHRLSRPRLSLILAFTAAVTSVHGERKPLLFQIV